jgi:hypothetical protein
MLCQRLGEHQPIAICCLCVRRLCRRHLGTVRAEDPQPTLPNCLPGVLLQTVPVSRNVQLCISKSIATCSVFLQCSAISYCVKNVRAQSSHSFASRQALGELTLFMPTAAAAKGDGDWGAWAPAWLDAWSLIAHCDFWDRHWMALFSRLAKHDTRSAQPPLTCAESSLECLRVAGAGGAHGRDSFRPTCLLRQPLLQPLQACCAKHRCDADRMLAMHVVVRAASGCVYEFVRRLVCASSVP